MSDDKKNIGIVLTKQEASVLCNVLAKHLDLLYRDRPWLAGEKETKTLDKVLDKIHDEVTHYQQ